MFWKLSFRQPCTIDTLLEKEVSTGVGQGGGWGGGGGGGGGGKRDEREGPCGVVVGYAGMHPW
jgi:hypothetical protein